MVNQEIYIRKVEMKDADLILDWENNEENWAVSENDTPYSMFDIVVLIGELQNVKKANQGRWMICLSENNKTIGCVDLTEIDFENSCSEVGILIADKSQRKKGLASLALKLIEIEAEQLELKKLSCSIHSTNENSIILFKQNGYNESEHQTNEIRFFEKWLKK